MAAGLEEGRPLAARWAVGSGTRERKEPANGRGSARRRAWEPTVVATRGGTARSVLGRGSIPPRRGSLAPSAAGLARPSAGPGKPAVLTAGGRAGGWRGPGGALAWRGLHVGLTDPSHFRLGPVKCRAQNTTLAPARRGSVHFPAESSQAVWPPLLGKGRLRYFPLFSPTAPDSCWDGKMSVSGSRPIQ